MTKAAMKTTMARSVFWSLLLAFLAWDWMHTPAVDLRWETPLIAAGSGQSSAGGHCAIAK